MLLAMTRATSGSRHRKACCGYYVKKLWITCGWIFYPLLPL